MTRIWKIVKLREQRSEPKGIHDELSIFLWVKNMSFRLYMTDVVWMVHVYEGNTERIQGASCRPYNWGS